MRVSASFAALEMLQNSKRTEQAQSGRARFERLETIESKGKERSDQTRHELQELKQKNLESPRDPQAVHRNQQADKQNFHRFKDINQLPTKQRHAVKTYLDNQRAAENESGGGELLRSIDYYA